MFNLLFGLLLLGIIIIPLVLLNYEDKKAGIEFLRRRRMGTITDIKQVPWVHENNKFYYRANPNTNPKHFLLMKTLEMGGYVIHDYMSSDPYKFVLTVLGENMLELNSD